LLPRWPGDNFLAGKKTGRRRWLLPHLSLTVEPSGKITISAQSVAKGGDLKEISGATLKM
jgi:Holliday junction resolvase